MIALAAAAGAGVALLLASIRLFVGPTLHDRAVAVYGVMQRAVLACAALAVAAGQPDWLEAAMALLFASFVLNAAILKAMRARTFQPPLVRGEEG